MKIQKINSLTPELVSLIEESQQFQQELYPSESIHQIDLKQFLTPNRFFVAAFESGELAGIGGFRMMQSSEPYAEIKNLFVKPEMRGRGIAFGLMETLEAEMISRGFNLSRLESGIYQPESIALYQRLGYNKRGSFGDYADDPYSVFMEKFLSRA